MHYASLLSLVAAALLMGACASNDNSSFDAQPSLPPINNDMLNPGAGSSSNDIYRLRSGDKLSIVVFGEDQLSGEFVIGDDGIVNLPSIGAVPATGQTMTDFQNDIVRRYASGYVTDPKVSVSVLNTQ
jgi:protein involved in polysaccharide export with SLBB domain